MKKSNERKEKTGIKRKCFEVWIDDPLSVNKMYVPIRGMKILSEEGRKYRGEWRKALKRKSFEDFKKDYIASHGPAEIFLDESGAMFIEGRLGKIFRKTKLKFGPKEKIVIEAYGFWKDEKKRDMSNMQKPIEDAFQDAGCMPDDSYLLWRNMDFEIKEGQDSNRLKLIIYKLEGA